MVRSRPPQQRARRFAIAITVAAGSLLGGAWITDEGSPTRQHGLSEAVVSAPLLGTERAVVMANDQRKEPWHIRNLRRRRRVTPNVRSSAFGGAIEAHPLVVEAAYHLVNDLSRYARNGAFVTSLVRTPEDQTRLNRIRRYRWWTTPRSKHLMGGLAVDIGFVGRRASMTALAKKAERVLIRRLGKEKAKLLRVVRESRCLHIEIDSTNGRAIIEERANALANMGIAPYDHVFPVPELKTYTPERLFLTRPREKVVAALP